MNEITINSSWASLDCLRDIIAIFPVCQLRPFMPVYFPVFGLSSHPCNWCPSSYSTFLGLYVFIIHPLNRSRIYHVCPTYTGDESTYLSWTNSNYRSLGEIQLDLLGGGLSPSALTRGEPSCKVPKVAGHCPMFLSHWWRLAGANSTVPWIQRGDKINHCKKLLVAGFKLGWIIFHNSIPYMGCHPSHWLSLHDFSRW
jgi:hypothetical protein